MRIRRLRDRLIALSAGLVVLVTLVTVLFVRVTTVEALRGELQASLANAGRPFEYAQRRVADLLFLQASRLSEDVTFQGYRLDYLSLRDRADVKAQDNLRSLREATHSLVNGDEAVGDLVVMTDPDGASVLVEHVAGREDRDLEGVRLDLPVVAAVMEEGVSVVSYGMYPDRAGDLYLLAAVPLPRGDYVDGVLVLGHRLDDETAREAATALGSTVYIVGSGRLLAGARGGQTLPEEDPSRRALAAWLSAWVPPEVARGREAPLLEADLGGTSWLLLPHPVFSEFDPQPIGWILFARDLESVQRRVQQQVLALGGMGLAGVLLALLLSTRTAGVISGPIERLAVKMKKVGEGDLDQEAEVAGADEVAQLAVSFNEMTTGLRQKHVLEKYVPLGARREISQNVEGRIVLGGVRVRATILFSDLRGFTSLSEKLAPDEVVGVLNGYLERMTGVIIGLSGDINEYIGDAILAVFHDREETPGARLAVRAALEMQRQLAEVRRDEGGVLATLQMGIGIHTGDLVEGNIGTRDRLKFSVVGDTVNLAARIQDRSRDGRHTSILISESCVPDLGDEFELDFFGDEQFKGKSAPTAVWEVVRARVDQPTAR